MNPTEKLSTAYHEAAHLVADILFNLRPREASVIGNGFYSGYVAISNQLRPKYSQKEKIKAWEEGRQLDQVCLFDHEDENLERQRRIGKKKIISSLAGFIAEKKVNPLADPDYSADDFEKVVIIIDIVYHFPKKYIDPDGVRNIGRFIECRFMPFAEKFVEDYFHEIEYTAELLFAQKILAESDIQGLKKIIKRKNKSL